MAHIVVSMVCIPVSRIRYALAWTIVLASLGQNILPNYRVYRNKNCIKTTFERLLPEEDHRARKIIIGWASSNNREKLVKNQGAQHIEDPWLPAAVGLGSAQEVHVGARPAECADLGVTPNRTLCHKNGLLLPPQHLLDCCQLFRGDGCCHNGNWSRLWHVNLHPENVLQKPRPETTPVTLQALQFLKRKELTPKHRQPDAPRQSPIRRLCPCWTILSTAFDQSWWQLSQGART